ncbi:MAG: bifunctional homocysteine S-methyltransferase/methylenetetrahydrofolate reductase [Planctomycetes bacterium]|nr:bifunctional homocysteine S-methyltransferase/methylenetetrahydrofolate reductase [Planctomycetota bacterium]
MTPDELKSRLAREVLVADGGMGSELYAAGVPLRACFDEVNLSQSDLVRRVHRAYAKAGAQLLETNTFGANPIRLARHGLEARAEEINEAGVRLAREAAPAGVLVAGSVGPIGPIEELDGITGEDVRRSYERQIGALAGAGVDLLILETFTSLETLLAAYGAARKVAKVAVVCQMAFGEDGRTPAGITPEQAVRELEAAGADAIGANCVNGPIRTAQVMERIASCATVPLSAFPNAGAPTFQEGRFLYAKDPAYIAEYAGKMVAFGVSLVGGCCGTTPEDIAAVVARVGGRCPGARPARVFVGTTRAPAPARKRGEGHVETFLDRKRPSPPITVELDPPRDLDTGRILAGARSLAEDKRVRVINVADNPLGVVRVGNVAMAAMIQEATGLETIIHVSCRDRNLIGLQSDLMGAWALGIRNLFPVTGDPAKVGNQPGATSVYDTNSLGLLDLIARLNRGESATGADLGGRTGFTAGVALNYSGRLEPHVHRLRKKVALGAQYVLTQAIYDVGTIRRLYAQTADLGVPVYLGIMPLVSERNAEFLHHEVPGIEIPEGVRARMKGLKGKAGRAQGLRIVRDILSEAPGTVPGFYIIPPFESHELALAVVDVIHEVARKR